MSYKLVIAEKPSVAQSIAREALINCDFSGNVLDGVDQAEVYIRDAYILRDMRKDYNLFNSQLAISVSTVSSTAEPQTTRILERLNISSDISI